MNLYFVGKDTEGDKEEQLAAFRDTFKLTDLDNADIIYCASINQTNKARLAHKQTGKRLAVYCWDYYKWAHEGKHHGVWDWKTYADLLKSADIIFVPSQAQRLRLRELLSLDSHVVLSGVRRFNNKVKDLDFILDPVRYYPDETSKWAVRAAEQLNIPIVHSEHQYSEKEFRELVAACSFMTSTVNEASTGGLTLTEGMWLGKQSLVSNSPYMGAKDYLKTNACYFQHDDYDDLVKQMDLMWKDRPVLRLAEVRDMMDKELTFQRMADQIYRYLFKMLYYNLD